MADIERILIVGGGIAGLSAAIALYRQGYAIELVERNGTWPTEGAGISVQPDGMRMLIVLGIGAAVEKRGAVIRWWRFCDADGEVLCETDLDTLWDGVAPFIGIERTKLHEALLAGAAPVQRRLGVALTRLSQSEHCVSVGFSDGSAAEYDLVVGADGITSTVRELAVSPAVPTDLGAMNWRSVAPIRPSGLTALQFLLGDGCFFGLCPVGEGRTYGFGYVAQPRLRDPVEGRLERLRRRFASFGDILQEYLASLEQDAQVHCSAMEWVDVETWYNGRVVLIGDAAHASSPLMWQGGCMAMEDAYVLAAELRAAETVEDALGNYVRRRKPRVAWVQQQSMAAAEALLTPPAARNLALRERGDAMMRSRFGPLVAPP